MEELSRNKALEIAEQAPEDAVVIGADTMVFFRENAMGKPEDEEAAKRMLYKLQGNIHQVYTGVTVIWQENGKRESFCFSECTDVSVYSMSEQEIKAYVETGEPMDKAGAYGIQGRFAAFIRGINGDYNNVVGLPIGRLYQELKKRDLIG